MLKDTTGTRGRPRGSTQKIKLTEQEEYDKLSDGEKFEILKAKLLKDMQNMDINPRPFKEIIKHRMETAGIKHHKKGHQLWARTLLERGKFREQTKDLAQKTVFGDIEITKFADGMQIELPLGYSLKQRKTRETIEIHQQLKIRQLIARIGM